MQFQNAIQLLKLRDDLPMEQEMQKKCSQLLLILFLFFNGIAGISASAQEQIFEALDPRATWPEVDRIPLSERLGRLNEKKIFLIKSWLEDSGFDEATQDLADILRDSGATPIIADLNVRYSDPDTQLWSRMEQEAADAFIYIAAASSSTTSYAFKWATSLEQNGLPGVVITFDQLADVGETTMQREGAALRSIEFSYPTTSMSEDSYSSALQQAMLALTEPLTSEEKLTGIIQAEPYPEVAAYGDLDTIQQEFYEKGLTDGLPIIPPTRDRVEAMLQGTSHPPNEVVATQFLPEGLQVTVRQVAINAVMAGCLPEHMPVLLATIEAFQEFDLYSRLLNSQLRSTNSFAFMQVVNGPIAQELNMNSGVNALGPGNHANSVMGRALRLFINNLGGGEPGVNIMAVVGNNANYSFMFAENERQSPWESYSASQGFDSNESTLTFFSGGWAHSGNYNLGSPFDRIIDDISRFEEKGGATLIISPQRAEDLYQQGMSKADVSDYVWRNARAELGWLRNDGFFIETAAMQNLPEDTLVPIFPEGSIHVIVAGGDASPMMQAWHMNRPQTVSIDKWR